MASPTVVQSYRSSGDDANGSQADRTFLSWLRENGARFDKVQWPRNTRTGVRGGVARKDIAAGEHMIIIPHRLMMSEVHAMSDPELGHVFRDKIPILKSDNGLALYLMQQTLKGDESFYWPYLRILPNEPRNLAHWDESRLFELQDHDLVRRRASRKKHIASLYDRTMKILGGSYPDLFSTDQYTFELFDFAWGTIQARAFGKRLKCSALVPMADCLNHGNVQTKYDFDVEGNGEFRLFASGNNHYREGAEVLNSYGRRPNENLLLEYGFAMLDNEWDEVELPCALSSWESFFDRKMTVLHNSGQYTSRLFRLRRDYWSMELLHFYRCISLTATELDRVDEILRERGKQTQPITTAPAVTTADDVISNRNCEGSEGCSQVCNWTLPQQTWVSNDVPAAEEEAETGATANNAVVVLPPEEGGGKDEIRNRKSLPMIKQRLNTGDFPIRALSHDNELAALTEIVMKLHETINAFPTTLVHDEGLLQRQVEDDKSTSPELAYALAYRITVKRVLERHLDMAERAIRFVQGVATNKEELESFASSQDNNDGWGTLSCAHTISSSIPSNDFCTDEYDSLPPSLMSYLMGLKNEVLPPQRESGNEERELVSGERTVPFQQDDIVLSQRERFP